MNKRGHILLLVAGCMLVAGSLFAGPVGLTVKAGTLGLGADLSVNLGTYFNVRAGMNGFNYERDVDLDEAEIEGDLVWRTIPVLLDWHWVGSGFRATGGVIINNNEIDLTATPTDTISFAGNGYQIGSLSGNMSWPDTALYAGIGYGNACGDDGQIHFACDFGIMFQGGPDVTIDATALNPVLQQSLEDDIDEEIANFEDDAEGVASLYPVISLGVSFTF